VFCTLLLAATPLSAQTRTATDTRVLALPVPGERTLRILSPTLLEITIVTQKEPDSTLKKIQNALGRAPVAPERALKALEVTIDGKPAKIAATGWKRRAVYAPIARRDLRVATELYLRLATPLPTVADRPSVVEVRDPSGALGEGSDQSPL